MYAHNSTTVPGTSRYALGHSDREIRRLRLQSDIWADATRRTLEDAGINRGMRVLDLGCGGGDVSLLAASLVGPEGSVVGIDRVPEAVGRAATRAHDEEMRNVSFRVADVETLGDLAGPFDAVIGRFVLMYLPDPAAAIRRLRHLLAPDAIAAFVEMDLEASRVVPEVALVTQTLGWVRRTLQRSNAETAMGPQVWRVLEDAGFTQPGNRVAWMAVPPPGAAVSRLLAETVRSLLPMIERFGIATAEDVGIESLAERLQAELSAARATMLPPAIIGTWARLTSSSASR